MSKKKPGRKVRVDFRQNRQQRRRADDWTRKYQTDDEKVEDTQSSESVQPKGELSRKRTIIVNDHDALVVDEAQWKRGTVVTVHGLMAFVDDDRGRQWQCTVRRILRTRQIEQRVPVTVGDRVRFSEDTQSTDAAPIAVIERVEPRQTTLSRREGRERRGREQIIVANADQCLIVASVGEPRLKPHLIDRYIVASHKGNLSPIICFNKCDLLTGEELGLSPSSEGGWEAGDRSGGGDDVDDSAERSVSSNAAVDSGDGEDEFVEVEEGSPLAIFDEFESLGYRCIWTSIHSGQGIDELRAALKDHVTVLSGQSGVGKSSLINAMQPGMELTTQDVSTENQKGKHTTTHARLLRLSIGGYVVDTPGIRSFDLWNVDPGELEALFVEFAPLVEKCRFSDCTHRTEDGCAIRAAVEAGEISERRYSSYLKMYAET